ncbi:unnamed protein product, partial [Effrenium voratum]
RQPDAELDSKTQRNQKALEVRLAGVCMENSEKTSRLTQKKLRTMITEAEKEIATQNRMLRKAKDCEKGAQKRKIWEVFAGAGRTSKVLAKMKNVEVEVFSLHTGWDLTDRKVQAKFLDRVREEEPDEILMAPMCRLWSQMQELSASRSPEAKRKLVELRRQDHNNVMQFVKRVYMEQCNNSREVTLEHPWTSRAWMTKAWHQLPGYETYVDQCAYGLKVPDDEGVVRPSKKPTKFLTTKKHLYHKVGRTCQCGEPHQALEGNAPGAGPRTKLAESYPIALARKLAEAMAAQDIDKIHAADEDVVMEPVSQEAVPAEPAGDGQRDKQPQAEERDQEVIEKNKVLKAKVGNQVFGYVKRLHKNLGHPSAPVLKQMLMEVQATENVLKAAEEYLCPHCVARQRPGGVPPAAGLTSKEFNDRIVVDSAWIAVEGGRRCVLTIQDQATRYIAVRILKNEKAEDLIKGVERAWIKQFGIPKYLRTDEAKGWASKALREWTAERNIALEIAPAESHNWLGAVERKHQVVRRALELYMEDSGKKNDSGLLQACVYVASQINSMSMVRGFTPQQWVMGNNPNQVQSLTGEIFSPTVSAIDEAGEFAAVQQKRLAAQIAFLKADSDARLRRAMNQNYRQIKDDVVIGQVVYYWREKGAGILQKQKWRGPRDLAGAWNITVEVFETGIPLVADPNAALRDLQALRARATTQYKDVFDPTIHEDQDEDELDAMYELEALDFDEEASPTSPARRMREMWNRRMLPVSQDPGGRLQLNQNHCRQLRLEDVTQHLQMGDSHGSQHNQPNHEHLMDGMNSRTCEVSGRRLHRHRMLLLMQDDDDLMVENVTFVDGAEPDLPAGWVIVDGEFELDEAWLVKNLRKNEASEKNMTADQRAQMMEAKKAELENYFRNQVWNFAEVNPGDESRIVSARWVLTWK